MKLFRTLILRPLWRDPLRTALTALAVALGVAVVVAIDLAGDAATGSFRSSLETLVGKADLAISANGGIDERWIGRLTSLPIGARFAPRIEAQIDIAGVGSIPLYGVDFVAEARSEGASNGERAGGDAVISKALAARLGMGRGQEFAASIVGRHRELHAALVVDSPTEFVAVDIADAQQLPSLEPFLSCSAATPTSRLQRLSCRAGQGIRLHHLQPVQNCPRHW